MVKMNLSSMNTVNWLLFGFWNVWMVQGTTLSPLISSYETWSRASTPYYVDSNVTIEAHGSVDIENGVEIIFNGDYVITIRGYLDACYDSDTSNYTLRGLPSIANSSNYTSFHSVNQSRMGVFYFEDSDSFGAFCNVLFERLYYGIKRDESFGFTPVMIIVNLMMFIIVSN